MVSELGTSVLVSISSPEGPYCLILIFWIFHQFMNGGDMGKKTSHVPEVGWRLIWVLLVQRLYLDASMLRMSLKQPYIASSKGVQWRWNLWDLVTSKDLESKPCLLMSTQLRYVKIDSGPRPDQFAARSYCLAPLVVRWSSMSRDKDSGYAVVTMAGRIWHLSISPSEYHKCHLKASGLQIINIDITLWNILFYCAVGTWEFWWVVFLLIILSLSLFDWFSTHA